MPPMDPLAARRLEEKERRRTEILDATLKVAGRVGLDALTMDEVAREARLSRGLLYVYFRDRSDLYLGLCERSLCLLHERFTAVTATMNTGRERLVAMGRAYVEFARECPQQFEVLARFEASDPAGATDEGNMPACLAAGACVHSLMTDALLAGISDGSVAATVGPPDTVAISLWALMHGVIQIASLKGAVLAQHQVTPEELVDQALRMATTLLEKG